MGFLFPRFAALNWLNSSFLQRQQCYSGLLKRRLRLYIIFRGEKMKKIRRFESISRFHKLFRPLMRTMQIISESGALARAISLSLSLAITTHFPVFCECIYTIQELRARSSRGRKLPIQLVKSVSCSPCKGKKRSEEFRERGRRRKKKKKKKRERQISIQDECKKKKRRNEDEVANLYMCTRKRGSG